MGYAIQSESSLWWNGESWGPEQAREEYDSVDDLPESLHVSECPRCIECETCFEDMFLSVYQAASEGFDVRYHSLSWEAAVRALG